MKLFTAKCHERATLQKLWCGMGNSSLLPVKCWPLLHVIRACCWRWPDIVARISAHSSKLAFVFIFYIENWYLGEQWILLPLSLNVSLDFVSENSGILGKQKSSAVLLRITDNYFVTEKGLMNFGMFGIHLVYKNLNQQTTKSENHNMNTHVRCSTKQDDFANHVTAL